MPLEAEVKRNARIGPVSIGPRAKPILPLGLGGSWFIPYSAPSAEDSRLIATMRAAYDRGIRHFDTGAGYGDGHSEELLGAFIKGRRAELFIASKSDPDQPTAEGMLMEVEGSLRRLQTEFIDLYYIHWPRSGRDMRPTMEGLVRARDQGKIRAIGVSNFSVEQMQQVQQVGRVDAHQLGYNLIWRQAEADVIPFCIDHDISVVTYSSLAHGILAGKFDRNLSLRSGDQRHRILPFRADLWPHVHAAVEKLKAIAAELGRPLPHLAIRWILMRPGIRSVLFGARTPEQADGNIASLSGDIPDQAMERMTAISDELVARMPKVGNLFGHYP